MRHLSSLDIYLQAPPKGTSIPYDPHRFDEYYAPEYGGFLMAEGGRAKRGMPTGRGNPGQGMMGGRMGGGRCVVLSVLLNYYCSMSCFRFLNVVITMLEISSALFAE